MKRKVIVIGLVGVVLIIGGIGTAVMTGVIGGHKVPAVTAGKAPPPPPKPKEPPTPDVFVDLPEVLVSLPGPDQTPRTLRLGLSLQMGDKSDASEIMLYQPLVVDAIQTFFLDLPPNENFTAGSLLGMRAALRDRIAKAVKPMEVEDITFRSMEILGR